MDIDNVFKVPNTQENQNKRNEIINDYKQANNIPANQGVNICKVINWAKDNK